MAVIVGWLVRQRDGRNRPIALAAATRSRSPSRWHRSPIRRCRTGSACRRAAADRRGRQSRRRCARLRCVRLPRAAVRRRWPSSTIDRATSSTSASLSWPVAAEERIEKAGGPGVEAELTVLEEDVHGLPERVIQDFDQLLVHEGGSVDLHRVVAGARRQGKGHGAAPARFLERGVTCRVAARRPKPITMSRDGRWRRARGRRRATDPSPAAPVCRRSPGCTNSTETCCASVASAPSPKASRRPPRRNRSAMAGRRSPGEAPRARRRRATTRCATADVSGRCRELTRRQS